MKFQKDFRPKVTFEWVKTVFGLLKANKIFLQPKNVKNFISPTNEYASMNKVQKPFGN